jgi:hypothetical protein
MVHRWLSLNLKKTVFVYFVGTRPPEVPPGALVIEGEQIRRVEDTRFLGVWIDARLNWRGPCWQVATKMRQLLGVLGRIRSDLNVRLISLYNIWFSHTSSTASWLGGTSRWVGIGPRVRPF